MEPILPQPGSASDPKDFVGRRATTERATRALLAGENLSLTDPRRMGKSFWIGHLCATTIEFTAIKIDYEGVSTAETFLTRTVEALSQHNSIGVKVKHRLLTLFDGVDVDLGPVTVKTTARATPVSKLLTDVVMSLNNATDQKPVLVCMDEVPLAIRNIAANDSTQTAHEVLQTLRYLRQSASNIRWIVAGSVGFHHVLRLCGASEGDVNDLNNLPLGPLQDDDSRELVQRLLLGIGRSASPQAIDLWIAVTGGIPFLIHKVANLLDDGSDAEIDPAGVEAAFDEFIADRDESRAVTHLLTRLESTYAEHAPLARKILDLAATIDEPIHPFGFDARFDVTVDQVNTVLDWLVDDHYLLERHRKFEWRYNVLRTIWRHRRRLE